MNNKTTFTFARRFLYFIALLLLTNNTVNAQYWSELGGTNALGADSSIYSICSDGYGKIYAGGAFNSGPFSFYVAEYDSAHWQLLGSTINGPIYTVYADPLGTIYAGGSFTNSSGDPSVCKLSYYGWTDYGINDDFNNAVGTICNDNMGHIYAAGLFTNNQYYLVVGLSGNTWYEISTNTLSANGPIYSLCSDRSGHLYAAGDFTNFLYSTRPHRYVAIYNDTSWSELGGINAFTPDSTIYALCTDTAGNIYAAGFFTNSTGNFYVAKWDGSVWSELGGANALAANSPILALCNDQSGNIYAAGSFTNSAGRYYVAKWDGSAWSELGGSNSLVANNSIYTICTDQIGNVYAAGDFTNGNGKRYVAKFGSNSTGLNEAVANRGLNLYPNPTTSKVNITSSSNFQSIKIFNQTGELLERIGSLNTDQYTLSVAQLVKGIYFVQVVGSNDASVQKLIVE